MGFRTEEDPSKIYYWPPRLAAPNSTRSYESAAAPPYQVGNSTTQTRKKKRRDDHHRKRQFTDEDRLIKSTSDHHTATELCESDTSFGPDFVSIKERRFCDMKARTVYPLCSVKVTVECFDNVANKLITPGPKVSAASEYQRVLEWE